MSDNKSTKIFHVITGLNDGGAEAALFRLCSSNLAFEQIVVSLIDEGKYGSLLRQVGVTVHCIGLRQGSVNIGGMVRLWRLLRREQPGVVQTWMYHADLVGGLLSRLAGVRRVFWGIHHTTLEPGTSRRSTILVARLNAWLSRWVPTGIVCCAERAREVHRELGYVNEKMTVIPNGYDLDLYRPDSESRRRLRAEWGIDEATPLLGMVGRFDPQKDHENLIQALSRLKQIAGAFRCLLVGRGMDAANVQLAHWLDQYGLQDEVLLLGQRSDIPAVMNAMDIHVLSSFSEAFPNVLAEAMACGTPCVTTDVGDAALIVGDAGWVVPPRNPELLAQSLARALEELQDQSVWTKRQQFARQRIAERFSIEHMVSAYHAVWNTKVVSEQSPPL